MNKTTVKKIKKGYKQLLILMKTKYQTNKWRSPRNSGLTPKTTKARVVRYAIIQSLQWFSELTHSSSDASKYNNKVLVCNILTYKRAD